MSGQLPSPPTGHITLRGLGTGKPSQWPPGVLPAGSRHSLALGVNHLILSTQDPTWLRTRQCHSWPLFPVLATEGAEVARLGSHLPSSASQPLFLLYTGPHYCPTAADLGPGQPCHVL